MVQLARVGHPLVDEYHAGAKVVEDIPRRASPGLVPFSSSAAILRVGILAAKLPGEFAPQSAYNRAVGFSVRVAQARSWYPPGRRV